MPTQCPGAPMHRIAAQCPGAAMHRIAAQCPGAPMHRIAAQFPPFPQPRLPIFSSTASRIAHDCTSCFIRV